MAWASWTRSAIALVILASLVASGQAPPATWTQAGGGPGRTGVAVLTPGPLDVVASYRLVEENETIGQIGFGPDEFGWGLVPTPYGLAGFAKGANGTCTPLMVTDAYSGEIQRREPVPCRGPMLAEAYDRARDLLLVCRAAREDAPVLEAIHPATGDVAWDIRPARDLRVIPAAPLNPIAGQPPPSWLCVGPAVDSVAGRAVVAFSDGFTKTVVALIGLDDRAVEWVQPLIAASERATPISPGPSVSEPVPYDPWRTAAEGFAAGSPTLTSTGFVVLGLLSQEFTPAIVWLDYEGNVNGFLKAERDYQQQRLRQGHMSAMAAAQGPLAAAELGGRLLLIDPSSTQTKADEPIDGFQDPATADAWPGARWWGNTILLPLRTTLLAYDSVSRQQLWPWAASASWDLVDTVVAPPGDAYVLAAQVSATGTTETALFRVDLRTGRELQRIPSPVRPVVPEPTVGDTMPVPPVLARQLDSGPSWAARLLPLPDGRGLMAWDLGGNVTVFATAAAAPPHSISLGDGFPRAGEPVEITVEVDGPPLKVVVAWGDGVVDATETGSPVTHAYGSDGLYALRVTAVLPDGRTSTVERPVDVGGAALTPVQRAFAPENADETYFALGIALTLLGAVAAFAMRRVRGRRLETELRWLAQIRQQARDDPHEAVRALGLFRDRLRERLSAGRLNDSQFSVLRNESTQLLRSLHHRIMAPLEGRISPRYARLLESAIEDNTLTQTELRELTEALETEGALSVQERLHLAKLVQAWT